MKPSTKSNVFLAVGAITGVLISIGIITYSIMQNFDRKTPDQTYRKSICASTTLSLYRPIQINYSLGPSVDVANTTTYKLCVEETLPGTTNYTTHCLSPLVPKDSNGRPIASGMTVYCGWSTVSQVRRIGITSSEVLIAILVILFIVFSKRIWGKLLGVIYLVLMIGSVAAMCWLFIRDAHDLHQSRKWCNTHYKRKLCNPTGHVSSPDMRCECFYSKYVGTVILDAFAVVVFLGVAIATLVRFLAFRFDQSAETAYDEVSTESSDTSNTYQQDGGYGEDPTERRAREIFSSYNYK